MKLTNLIPGLAIAFSLGVASPPALSEDLRRGETLYHDHCDICHDALNPPNQGKKLKSLQQLHLEVTSWVQHSGEKWSQQDIDDVVFYLNRSYYHFDNKTNKPIKDLPEPGEKD